MAKKQAVPAKSKAVVVPEPQPGAASNGHIPSPVPLQMFMPQLPQQQLPMPPTMNASQFGVTTNVQEIIITYGHTRIPIDPTSGNPSGIAKEWLTSVSMSPAAAKMLATTLSTVMGQYESLYGRIPLDEGAVQQTLDNLKAAFKAAQANTKKPSRKTK